MVFCCFGKKSSTKSNSKCFIIPPVSYMKELRKEILFLHNDKRLLHQAKPVKESKDIDKAAQTYAELLATNNNGLIHEQDHAKANSGYEVKNTYGENLGFLGQPLSFENPKEDARKVFNLFYDEIKKYDFNEGYNRSRFPKYGHFTQLVWADCTEIGIGVAVTEKPDANGLYSYYYCIKYSPAGNLATVEEFKKNVLPPK